MLRAVEVAARVPGTREELYAILADVGRYSAWVPGVDHSSILAREGDVAVAELRGRRFGDRAFNLELVYSPPAAITFRQIDSLDRSEISGQWQLGDTEPGVPSPVVRVRLRLRLEMSLFGLGRRRASTALRTGLDALAARRRHLASARPSAAVERHKVLEIVRHEGGLKVWYLGESYVIPTAGAEDER